MSALQRSPYVFPADSKHLCEWARGSGNERRLIVFTATEAYAGGSLENTRLLSWLLLRGIQERNLIVPSAYSRCFIHSTPLSLLTLALILGGDAYPLSLLNLLNFRRLQASRKQTVTPSLHLQSAIHSTGQHSLQKKGGNQIPCWELILKKIFFPPGFPSSFVWETLRQPETRPWKSEWVIMAGRLYTQWTKI